jgi:peptide/nickel transport system permease protein
MIAQQARELQIDTACALKPRPGWLSQALSLLAHDKASLLALSFLLALSLAAAFAPLLIPEAELKMDFSQRLVPPTLTGGHILGADSLGRDLLSRILMASRVSLALSALVVALSVAIGVALGLIAGYFGGWFDDVIMRFVDLAMGFPSLLLALIVIYALGPSVVNMVFVLVITRWMLYARVVRAETLRLRRFDYVEAGRVVGGANSWIIRKHILPNLLAVLFTLASLEFALVMLSESSLSFLGLGIQPPDASLGLLVAQGRDYMQVAWWLMLFPGLAIFLITMSFTILSNWLGICMDPVQRWRLTSARGK